MLRKTVRSWQQANAQWDAIAEKSKHGVVTYNRLTRGVIQFKILIYSSLNRSAHGNDLFRPPWRIVVNRFLHVGEMVATD